MFFCDCRYLSHRIQAHGTRQDDCGYDYVGPSRVKKKKENKIGRNLSITDSVRSSVWSFVSARPFLQSLKRSATILFHIVALL